MIDDVESYSSNMPSSVPSLHFQTRDKLLNAVCAQIPVGRPSHPYASITQAPAHATEKFAARASAQWQLWTGDLLRRTYPTEDIGRYSSERIGECAVYCFATSLERDAFVEMSGSVPATLVRVIPG